MTPEMVIDVGKEAGEVIILLSAPPLLAGLAVGLLVAYGIAVWLDSSSLTAGAAGNAEIEDLRLAVLVHQHVGRLQVAMHDAAQVGVVRRARQLRQQADARAQVGLLVLQVAAQVRAAHDFQREPGRRQAAHRGLNDYFRSSSFIAAMLKPPST